jgi:hypothetical protein
MILVIFIFSVIARLDRAIRPPTKSHFAARTRGGWMAASSAPMTQEEKR